MSTLSNRDSEDWEIQSNVSETPTEGDIGYLSESTFDKGPETATKQGGPKVDKASRDVVLSNVGGSGHLVIGESDNSVDLAAKYCEANGLDYEMDGGEIIHQVQAKQVSLLRWKLSQNRRKLAKVKSQDIQQKFKHAVNLLQRTQSDKKKLAAKMTETRSNLHEKTEELVRVLGSFEEYKNQASTELEKTKNNFETYKKKKENEILAIEEHAMELNKKVVMESIDMNAEDRVQAIQDACKQKIQLMCKDFEAQLDSLHVENTASVGKLQRESKMATTQLARTTREFKSLQLTHQTELQAQLHRVDLITTKLQQSQTRETEKDVRLQQLQAALEKANVLREEAIVATSQILSTERTQEDTHAALEKVASVARETKDLAVAQHLEKTAAEEEVKMQALRNEHEKALQEKEREYAAKVEEILKIADERITQEVENAEERALEAEKKAASLVQHAQSKFAKRRSSVLQQKNEMRRNSIQEKNTIAKQAEENLLAVAAAHQKEIEAQAVASKELAAGLKTQLQVIQENMIASQRRVEQLQAELADVNVKATSQMDKDKDELDNAQEIKNQLEAQITKLTSHISTMKTAAKKHQADTEKMTDCMAAAEAELVGARKQVNALQNELTTEKNKSEEAAQQMTKAAEAKAENANIQYEKQLEKLQQDLVSMKEETKKATSRIVALQNELKEQHDASQLEVKLLRKESAQQINDIVTDMNGVEEDHAQELQVVGSRVAELEAKYKGALVQHQNEVQQHQETAAKHKKLDRELTKATRGKEVATNLFKAAKDKHTEEILQLQAEHETKHSDAVQRYEEEVKLHAKTKEEHAKHVDKLTSESSVAVTTLAETTNLLENHIAKLEQQSVDADTTISELQNQVSSHKESIMAYEQEKLETSATHVKLQMQADTQTQRADADGSSITRLQNKLDSLISEHEEEFQTMTRAAATAQADAEKMHAKLQGRCEALILELSTSSAAGEATIADLVRIRTGDRNVITALTKQVAELQALDKKNNGIMTELTATKGKKIRSLQIELRELQARDKEHLEARRQSANAIESHQAEINKMQQSLADKRSHHEKIDAMTKRYNDKTQNLLLQHNAAMEKVKREKLIVVKHNEDLSQQIVADENRAKEKFEKTTKQLAITKNVITGLKSQHRKETESIKKEMQKDSEERLLKKTEAHAAAISLMAEEAQNRIDAEMNTRSQVESELVATKQALESTTKQMAKNTEMLSCEIKARKQKEQELLAMQESLSNGKKAYENEEIQALEKNYKRVAKQLAVTKNVITSLKSQHKEAMETAKKQSQLKIDQIVTKAELDINNLSQSLNAKNTESTVDAKLAHQRLEAQVKEAEKNLAREVDRHAGSKEQLVLAHQMALIHLQDQHKAAEGQLSVTIKTLEIALKNQSKQDAGAVAKLEQEKTRLEQELAASEQAALVSRLHMQQVQKKMESLSKLQEDHEASQNMNQMNQNRHLEAERQLSATITKLEARLNAQSEQGAKACAKLEQEKTRLEQELAASEQAALVSRIHVQQAQKELELDSARRETDLDLKIAQQAIANLEEKIKKLEGVELESRLSLQLQQKSASTLKKKNKTFQSEVNSMKRENEVKDNLIRQLQSENDLLANQTKSLTQELQIAVHHRESALQDANDARMASDIYVAEEIKQMKQTFEQEKIALKQVQRYAEMRATEAALQVALDDQRNDKKMLEQRHALELERVQNASRVLMKEQKSLLEQRFREQAERFREQAEKDQKEPSVSKKTEVDRSAKENQRKMSTELKKLYELAEGKQKLLLEYKAKAENYKIRAENAERRLRETKENTVLQTKKHLQRAISEYTAKNEVRIENFKREERKLRHDMQNKNDATVLNLRLELVTALASARSSENKTRKVLEMSQKEVQRLSTTQAKVGAVGAAGGATAQPASSGKSVASNIRAETPQRQQKLQEQQEPQELQESQTEMLNRLQNNIFKAETARKIALRTSDSVRISTTTQSLAIAKDALNLYIETRNMFSARVDTLLNEVDRLKGRRSPMSVSSSMAGRSPVAGGPSSYIQSPSRPHFSSPATTPNRHSRSTEFLQHVTVSPPFPLTYSPQASAHVVSTPKGVHYFAEKMISPSFDHRKR